MENSKNFLTKDVTIVAYAGEDAANSNIPLVVNDYLGDRNLKAHMIGISIRDDDFEFFIKNLKNSKVEVTLFAQEFQKRAADFFNLEGFLIASFKKGDKFILVEEDKSLLMDDRDSIKVIEKILMEKRR